MSVGNRIKNRREELGLTMDDVAKRIGTARQTVFKYENEIVKKIPYDKVELLAEVLHVSPGYLFGWEGKSPDKQELTEGEKALLELFRKVPKEQQELVLQMIQAALNASK